MKRIKYNAFIRTAAKFLKKEKRTQRFVSYEKANNILLLFSSDLQTDNPAIKQIVQFLKKDNKKVKCIGFINAKELPPHEESPEITLFCKKDINFLGKPEKKIINEATNQQIDILIDLSLTQPVPLLYLALYTNSPLKIGTKKFDIQLFDFILDISNKSKLNDTTLEAVDEQFLFNEIIFYLKSIQTND